MIQNNSDYYVIQVKYLRLFAVVLTLVIVGLIVISGTLAASNDGRINVVHHFGGDVFYCVDENRAATNDFNTMQDGGLQVLNMNGQSLLYVPGMTVMEKVNEAQPGGGNVLVAEGQGTYGPISIYVYKTTAGIVHFIFVGVDEHGKTNQVDSVSCLPVNPPSGASSPKLCMLSEVNNALLNEDFEAFSACFELACPDIDSFDGPAFLNCFCPQYPDSLACRESSEPR